MLQHIYRLQRRSAVALLVLLLIHTHFVAHMPVNQPWWKAIDVAFLFTLLLHGLSGVYVMVTGSRRSQMVRRAAMAVVATVGILAFAYSASVVLAF